MPPADLTPTEIADQLARMYAADQGQSDDAPTPAERTALADSLGCHEEARAAAWALIICYRPQRETFESSSKLSCFSESGAYPV